MTSVRDAMSIISTMIGAEATPLITALQNRAPEQRRLRSVTE
jgi:hypothetical protein